MIGIIGAMPVEIEYLVAHMERCKEEIISRIRFYKGSLFGADVVVAVSGVGKVHAAICAQTMILRYAPTIILNTGVAGGLAETLATGDIVIASSIVQHDVDNSGIGDPVGFISDIGIHIPCTGYLVDRFRALAESINEYDCFVGAVATGDRFVVDSADSTRIRERFGALACEQEGGSIAQVCYVNDVDFCIIRAVSDKADMGSNRDYFEFVHMAAARSSRLIESFLQSYHE